MVFENLAEKLGEVFKKLKGKGKLTEADVLDAMRMVRRALLEADVNFKIVKEFIGNVTQKAVGNDVLESLTPGQQVIKIVNEELTALMGKDVQKPTISPKPPTIFMLMGLQGAGKTTTCAKLAKLYKKQGKNPLLVACDIYRPAAIQQLEVLGAQIDVPVFTQDQKKPPEISKNAIAFAENNGYDLVIIDTAGRLHIDDVLMQELQEIQACVHPHESLLTLDSMTGQDAVNVATSFNEQLDITGAVLTKLDGDTRGGAALSIRAVVGKPIMFSSMGEKLDDIEPFYPDRMASRILGMGDVLTLIDKAQSAFDEKQAAELEKKLRQNSFDLNDFLNQMEQMKSMGPLDQLMGMLPGMNKANLKGATIDEKQLARTEAIIKSMTMRERERPDTIDFSRRKRIAAGSGTSVSQVNALLKQFEQMQKLFKQFSNPKQMKKLKGLKFPF